MLGKTISQQALAKATFSSLLLDGSTGTGNIDNEILLLAWCDRNRQDEKINTQMEYFKEVSPRSD